MEIPVSFFSNSECLRGNLHLPYSGAPAVLLSHGLDSSKDGAKWVTLAPRLYGQGIASLRFSYRGCGQGPDASEGAFEDTTLTGRVQDFRAALEFLRKAGVSPTRRAVIGSSFGGTVALAAREKGLRAMVLLATPAGTPPFFRQGQEKAEAEGFLGLGPGRRLKPGFFTDVQCYDVLECLRSLDCPLLIIHGSEDRVLPVADAHRLYQAAREPRQLEIIEGAGHDLADPVSLGKVVNLALEWLQRFL